MSVDCFVDCLLVKFPYIHLAPLLISLCKITHTSECHIQLPLYPLPKDVTFFSVLKCGFDFSLCDREEAAQAQAPNLNAGIKTRLL